MSKEKIKRMFMKSINLRKYKKFCTRPHSFGAWHFAGMNEIVRECYFCDFVQNRIEWKREREQLKKSFKLIKNTYYIDLFWG